MEKWNLQTALSEMHADLKADIAEVKTQVTGIDTKVNAQEVRIVIVENHRKAVRWLAALLITTLVTALIARYL